MIPIPRRDKSEVPHLMVLLSECLNILKNFGSLKIDFIQQQKLNYKNGTCNLIACMGNVASITPPPDKRTDQSKTDRSFFRTNRYLIKDRRNRRKREDPESGSPCARRGLSPAIKEKKTVKQTKDTVAEELPNPADISDA